MGKDPNESGGRKGAKQQPAAASPGFWSFHPTEKEKAALDVYEAELSHPTEVLGNLIARGIAFSVTRARTNDSFCVVARNPLANWGEGQALSVFHADLGRAIAGMCYVLDVLHPDWPAKPVREMQANINW